MNKTLRNRIALLLGVALLLCALPFAVMATGSGSEVLHSWTASTLEKDTKVFTSNLVSGADKKVRWNESGVMYTAQGKENVVLHNFLNEVGGSGNSAYALPRDEMLMIDAYPVVKTKGMEAIDLSLIYAYKTAGKATNVATNNRVCVYVSKNGMDWLNDYVTVRAANIVGSGTVGQDTVVYYEIHMEDLLGITGLNEGDYIRGVRILPDGVNGTPSGAFALCKMTFAGYESKAEYKAAVPAKADMAEEFVAVDEAKIRKALVDAAAGYDGASELGKVMAAYSMVTNDTPATEMDLLNTTGIELIGDVSDKARDSVKMLFTYMYERNLLTQEAGDQKLADYETVKDTRYLLREMNTPQQVLRAYAQAKAGDILMQAVDTTKHVYMVKESNPVYMLDGVNVDPYQSTLTYLTLKSENTETFYDLYSKGNFAPFTAAVLKNGTTAVAQVEAQASFADGVHVAVVSSLNMDSCQIAVGGTTVTMDDLRKSAVVCSDEKLAAAVAALADGKHQMTVTVTSGLSDPTVVVIDFQIKDGKATVLGTTASDHKDICPAKAMADVAQDAWYHEAVDYALTNGIMGGYNATTFGPNDTLSRAMVVQVLYNKEGQPAVSGKHTFADVPADQWFNNAVTWGTSNGVMGGYNATTFGPNDKVTIEQIAVILWNYAGKPAFAGNADSVGAHSDWAANALSWAVENDILEGVPFENATADATRAQTAQMLMNYLENN